MKDANMYKQSKNENRGIEITAAVLVSFLEALGVYIFLQVLLQIEFRFGTGAASALFFCMWSTRCLYRILKI